MSAPLKLTLFALCLLLLVPCVAQQRTKSGRLILKDGSYELVGKYEIRGDRVRYFSTERNAWEEIPSSLVDWPATEQYAGRAVRDASEKSRESLEKAAAERSEEEAHAPVVAPGIRLPSPDGVYLLDIFQGEPELVPLLQNGADLNKNTGRNILRGVINPLAGPRQTLELKGLRAQTRSHESSPSIYFPIDPADSEAGYNSATAKDHLRIVRCTVKKENRIVSALDIALYGKVKQRADYISVSVTPVSEYWVKITPSAPLQDGEYALVEYDDKGRMNQFVWDFAVDPSAPANASGMKSIPDRSEPALILKPKKNSPKK